jgi:hypothetical protein
METCDWGSLRGSWIVRRSRIWYWLCGGMIEALHMHREGVRRICGTFVYQVTFSEFARSKSTDILTSTASYRLREDRYVVLLNPSLFKSTNPEQSSLHPY